MTASIRLSVIVSCFNEERALPTLWEVLFPVLKSIAGQHEVLFVDDGSRDGTVGVARALEGDDQIAVRVIRLSRNFGHEAAMLAGIDHARGDCIVCMDADLQHPPERLPQMLESHNAGAEIVHMVRTRGSESVGRKLANTLFYGLLGLLLPFHVEPNATDFFLIDRQVAVALTGHFRRRARFIRGFLQMVGYRVTYLEFNPGERVAGSSKYRVSDLFKLAVQAVLAVSTSPLRVGMITSAASSFCCLLLALYTTYSFFTSDTPPGYSTIVILLCVMFVVLFAILSLVLVYLERVHVEVRQDPIYLLREPGPELRSGPHEASPSRAPLDARRP